MNLKSIFVYLLFLNNMICPMSLNLDDLVESIDNSLNNKLLYASRVNNKNLIKELLKKGANINFKDHNGITALMIAAFNNNKEALYLLIKNNADLNAQDIDGNTALIWAASKSRNNKSIRLLIENNSQINHTNFANNTALHIAICSKNYHGANLLISKGADGFIRNNQGKNAFILCAEDTLFTNCLEKLIENYIKEQNNSDEILVFSNLKNKIGPVDLEILENIKSTTLIVCLKNNFFDLFNYLVKNGANVNVKDLSGKTILLKAILDKKEEFVKVLLESKALVFLINNYKKSILEIASKNKKSKIIKMLNNRINSIIDKKTDLSRELYDYNEIIECPICFKNYPEDSSTQDFIILDCHETHIFCFECINKHIISSIKDYNIDINLIKCPLCNKKISPDNIDLIFYQEMFNSNKKRKLN